MADDPTVLAFMQSLDRRFETLQTSVTTAQQLHQQSDDTKHEAIDGRMKSLENSRLAARVGMATLLVGTPTVAAKVGILDKIISMFP